MTDGDDPRELFARLRAEEDQAHAGIKAVAQRLGSYRIALICAGFSEDQAWELVAAYSDFLLGRFNESDVPDA